MVEFRVNITSGTYNGREITGTYTALKPVGRGTRGWFVTIPGSEVEAGSKTARVLLNDKEAQLVQAQIENNSSDKKAPTEPEVSSEVALERMIETFEILEEMITAITDGHVDGMIVFGPPGVGKSWNVINALNEASLDRVLQDQPPRHTVRSGYMTTVHLYMALWECREPGQILVLDDLDSVFSEPESLNLLKAALDTTGVRSLGYAAESKVLSEKGIPNYFEFNGGVIFITNVDFEHGRGKIQDHLDAMISRCHYLDLTIDTKRDKLLWLKHVTLEQGMLRRKGLDQKKAREIIEFIEENIDNMRELSLRMVLKLADLRRIEGKFDWQKKARVTCMKRDRRSQLSRVIPEKNIA